MGRSDAGRKLAALQGSLAFSTFLAHVPQSHMLEMASGLKAVFSQVSMESVNRAIADLRAKFSDSLTKAMLASPESALWLITMILVEQSMTERRYMSLRA
jgi:hypothetical protein